MTFTTRQVSVLKCLQEGLSNKEIARHEGIAHGTVKIHVANVIKLLNARNRGHAAVLSKEALKC